MLKWLVLACGLATAAGLLAWRLAPSSDYIAPAAGQDRLRGQADGKLVNQIARDLLTGVA